MKRISFFLVLILGGYLMMGAEGCSSDPNVEGAKLDLRNKDYDRALENVNTALERNPENVEALQLKGQILQAQAGNVKDLEQHQALVQEMLTAYNRARELAPDQSEAITQQLRMAYYNEFQQGIQAFNRGQENKAAYNDAIVYFDLASDIMPDSSGAYVNEAFAYLNSGQQQKAIAPFEQAIEHGDDQTETYLFLADLYVANDQAPQAVTLLEQARKKFPDNADVQAQLLNAYIQADQIDRAMETYQEAVAREPENKLYRYNYGSLLLEASRYEEAIEQLEHAVRLDAEYGNAQYNLGAAYVNMAVDVSDEINALDDKLREQRDQLSESEIEQIENQMEELAEERRSLFAKAVTPLEKAKTLAEQEGKEASEICRALFSAYVQTDQQEKAESIAECAGYEDIN